MPESDANPMCPANVRGVVTLLGMTFAPSGSPAVAEKVLDTVPLIRQPDPISCGPTCASMVLRYYGADEEGTVTRFAGLRSRVALMSPRGLGWAMERRGVDASVLRGDLEDLVKYIDQGRPPILLVRISPVMWHYVVVVGYRARGAQFRLADPYGRRAWIDGRDLDQSWAFEGDLDGHRLEDRPCTACGGRRTAGPCASCGGDGKAPDVVREALATMGLTPHLLIVPDRAPAAGPTNPRGSAPGQP